MSLNVVFMGTPEFSVPTLQALIRENFNIIKVYTQPPKKSKRGQKINPSHIEKFCKKNNIDVSAPLTLDNEKEIKTEFPWGNEKSTQHHANLLESNIWNCSEIGSYENGKIDYGC